MDIKRDPAILQRKKRRQWIFAGAGVVALIVVSFLAARLPQAAPAVSSATLWFGTVKRGEMVREVHGVGTLVPDEIRWIPARTSGRVERILLRPGAQVTPGSVILELSNPELRQQAMVAELNWRAGLAQLENQRATLASQRLSQEANVADLESQHEVALANLEANKELANDGLVSQLTIKQLQATLNQARNRLELARKQLKIAIESETSQIAPQEATVNQLRAAYDLLLHQLDDLKVKAPMRGVLQLVSVQEGQTVGTGTNLARVADPSTLKAEVRISETQTRDLTIGLRARVDTRNGVVQGRVSRIDPAAQGGTVGVDITLEGDLPAGARPDLSVDGTIELERLENVLYVESPTFGQENSTVSLFKVVGSGEAVRTSVQLGRRSVQFVEVRGGLAEGDRVVLSDMAQYDSFDRIRLN